MKLSGEFVIGIDGGGTSTTARVERDGEVVMARTGGPTNVTWTSGDVLIQRLAELLRGFPTPSRAAICLAGIDHHRCPARLEKFFAERFPGAAVRFEPDYAAALCTLPKGTLVGVIAGSGSVVCSRDPAGTFVSTGGNGYQVDDYGSSYRLGQALVSRFLEDPLALDHLTSPLCRLLGVQRREEMVDALHQSGSTPSLLAGAAPLVTAAADAGERWANEVIEEQLAPLAAMTARHLFRHHRSVIHPTVGLVGGVWESPSTVRIFTRLLRAKTASIMLTTVIASRPPVHGAVRLALE